MYKFVRFWHIKLCSKKNYRYNKVAHFLRHSVEQYLKQNCQYILWLFSDVVWCFSSGHWRLPVVRHLYFQLCGTAWDLEYCSTFLCSWLGECRSRKWHFLDMFMVTLYFQWGNPALISTETSMCARKNFHFANREKCYIKSCLRNTAFVNVLIYVYILFSSVIWINVRLCLFYSIFTLKCCRLYHCWISSLALIVISVIHCFILDAIATPWSAHLVFSYF